MYNNHNADDDDDEDGDGDDDDEGGEDEECVPFLKVEEESISNTYVFIIC